jgi:hypothetical protein
MTMIKTKARHEVGTRSPGNLWLQYSSEWNGFLKGRVLNGDLNVHGSFDEMDWRSAENDEIIEDGRKKIYAWRGELWNTTKFRVGTGNANVGIGPLCNFT